MPKRRSNMVHTAQSSLRSDSLSRSLFLSLPDSVREYIASCCAPAMACIYLQNARTRQNEKAYASALYCSYTNARELQMQKIKIIRMHLHNGSNEHSIERARLGQQNALLPFIVPASVRMLRSWANSKWN